MSSIQRLVEKIKGLGRFEAPNLRTIPDDLFLGLIIILVAFGSFGLGRLSKIQGSKTPVRFENALLAPAESVTAKTSVTNQSASVIDATSNSTDLVGSKNGTKYYYPWCSGVKNIFPSNLIHFASKSEAEARGYTPSATCKGL
ncbi:MAG: hypothetical protein WC791_01195 [Candidatus Paceibacterota bacterium]|jgi:hypothetical protein